jgi:ribonucleoside-diphosphate reductase beta chain
MSSFAPTFAVCNTGLFNPIGKAVQKIAQEELEIHVEMGKEVFKFIPAEIWDRIKPNIEAILSETVERELTWAEYLFAEGDELVGVNEHLLKEWVLFNAKDLYKLFKFESKYSLPKVNPLKFMEKWLDISKTQPSPQEEDNGQYKLNSVRKDDVGTTFEIDF